jgi:hypothetical protein
VTICRRCSANDLGGGNGVLLVSEFAASKEARRIAYHVIVKSYTKSMNDDNEYKN